MRCATRLKSTKPASRKIQVILSDFDTAIHLPTAKKVAEQWKEHGADVTEYTFAKDLKIWHDLIDPEQSTQQIDVVYPVVLPLLTQNRGVKRGETCRGMSVRRRNARVQARRLRSDLSLRCDGSSICPKLQIAFDKACKHVTLRKISPYPVSLMTLDTGCWRPTPTPLHHSTYLTEAPANG